MASSKKPFRPRPAIGVAFKATLAASAAVLAAALAALALAAPAGAEVVEVSAPAGESVQVGLQPREEALLADGNGGEDFANLSGRPIVSSSRVYAIYWDPDDAYHGDWQQLIDGFFSNMSESSGLLADVFAVDTQYTDAAAQHAAADTIFAGAYTDTDRYPAVSSGCNDPSPLEAAEQPWDSGPITCLTDGQIRAELERFLAAHSLPKGMGSIYYVLTPPGVTDCLPEETGVSHCSDYSGLDEPTNPSYADSFCSYHADINPGNPEEGSSETILYAAIPWTAGGLGDYHLTIADETSATECQSGEWVPPTEGSKGAEEQKVPSIEQEPNQIGIGPDGSYDTGLADLIIGQIANEQQNIVTNPLLNAWQGTSGEEETDLCRNFFAPALGGSATREEGTEAGTTFNDEFGAEGVYYLNDAFDLAATKLVYPGVPCLKGASLEPSFTAPADANAGEIIGFDGMESDISLDAGTAYAAGKETPTYPTYEWNFGDGSSPVKGYAPGAPSKNSPEASPCEEPWLAPCAASAYHAYVYGGTYEVTLTVTDTGGHVASVTKPVSVVGPPPPSQASGQSPGSGGSATQTGQKGTSGKTGKGKKSSSKPSTSPVLKAVVLTKSIAKATKKGLQVRYSVNQQAAGRFEVMMSSSVAKRLHIHGTAAKGLPKGTKPQTVIASALLETTRSAHHTITIRFAKQTAQQLAHLSSLSLTVRLEARNASASEPKVTVLETAATLKH
ncbi:MAG TPA: hypothetical protein VGF95_00925 [Solirubrobacteraceae bacterium]